MRKLKVWDRDCFVEPSVPVIQEDEQSTVSIIQPCPGAINPVFAGLKPRRDTQSLPPQSTHSFEHFMQAFLQLHQRFLYKNIERLSLYEKM